jgi:hypothetical protein
MAERKPIIHRKCGKRIPDGDELVKDRKSKREGDEVCICFPGNGSEFATPAPASGFAVVRQVPEVTGCRRQMYVEEI